MKFIFIFTVIIVLYFLNSVCICQSLNSKELWNNITKNDDNDLSFPQKLRYLDSLKKLSEVYRLTYDSSYVLTLIKISKYEFYVSYNYDKSVKLIDTALRLNRALKLKSSILTTVMGYFYLSYFDQKFMLYKQALNYYDSCSQLCKKINDINFYAVNCFYNKSIIYFSIGDYQKAIDECTIGMRVALFQKDTADYTSLLNLRAKSYSIQNNFHNAIIDAEVAIPFAKKTENTFELGNSYSTLAYVYERQNKNETSIYFFNECLKVHLLKKYFYYIANDYTDLGNFYLNNLNEYRNAERCYKQTLVYANKIDDPLDRNLKKAMAYTNLSENSFRQNKLYDAEVFLLNAFESLRIKFKGSLLKNASSLEINKCIHKDLVINLMNDKTNLLLQQYKSNHDKSFLTACIQSALVTDSVITKIRHEQLGEQSKLYWRDKTRDFFSNAIEACYLNNNPSLAFYFMEKSRAVLLNDKLNELSASSYLSAADAAKQDDYQVKIVELEQKLSASSDSSSQYQTIQLQLLDVKNNLEGFIKSLEQKYPAYYQYKYADDVSSLSQLQSYLKQNNQSFVHYFLGDTVIYILAITATSTKFIYLSQTDFDKEQLSKFLQLCANKEMLMNHYEVFATLSKSIYKNIFQSLQLPAGRVIICSDNIVIPFDALCTDKTGNNFLLNNYSFSYVYSARSLIKSFYNKANAKGNFIGFAPVSFATHLHVQDLKNAADALQSSSSYYNTNKLFTYQNATRSNFFKYACNYSIVNIFSHAHADTTDNEPVLYMQDSLIHLSELQLLNNPATKLVLLSACQTNVGKTATGEGIYSLARGFAIAGIPSVSATLWKADEETIYAISEKFNQYLSEGMNKDEALQKAKLFFISNNTSNEKLLPYYWANMILIGNTDAIHSTKDASNLTWLIIAFSLLIILAAYFIYTKTKIMKFRRY